MNEDPLTPTELAFRAFVRNRRAFAEWAREARYLWIERKAIEEDRAPPVAKKKREERWSSQLPFSRD